METSECDVVAVEIHTSSQDGASFRQVEVQHGELTAGDVLQNLEEENTVLEILLTL